MDATAKVITVDQMMSDVNFALAALVTITQTGTYPDRIAAAKVILEHYSRRLL